MAWQVHGADVREVDERAGAAEVPGARRRGVPEIRRPRDEPAGAAAGAADGRLPSGRDRRDRRRRLAVLHAGWRGLVAGIVERGVGAVGGRATAAVGPGAGPCCYEVGEDVADVLRGGSATTWSETGRPTCGWRARRALEGAGVADVRSPASAPSAGPSGTSRTGATMAPRAGRGSWGCSVVDPAVVASNLARVRAEVGPDVEILAATKYVERRRPGRAPGGRGHARRREPHRRAPRQAGAVR